MRDTSMSMRTGVVMSVGGGKVSVTVGDTVIAMPYIVAPATSDKVLLLKQGSTWVCVGPVS